MSKQVVSEIENSDVFYQLILKNPGLIIIKLGATWCGPCKIVQPALTNFFATSPPEVICCDIDVDVCPNFYSFLQSKRMVNGIPAILCYKKGNSSYIPDDSVVGADMKQVHMFFKRCGTHLTNAIRSHPNPVR